MLTQFDMFDTMISHKTWLIWLYKRKEKIRIIPPKTYMSYTYSDSLYMEST